MLSADRQEKLDPVLSKLNSLPGIEGVFQDDFDSNGINVFFTLKPKNWFDGRALSFEIPLAQLKRNLNKLFKELKVDFRVTDYPSMKYEHTPARFRFKGDPVSVKIGYDQTRYGIEVFV